MSAGISDILNTGSRALAQSLQSDSRTLSLLGCCHILPGPSHVIRSVHSFHAISFSEERCRSLRHGWTLYSMLVLFLERRGI
jgi:hypothetical protein